MPLIKIWTNVRNVPPNFITDTIKLVAELLGKPAERTMCLLESDKRMQLGLEEGPCAMMTLHAIGKMDKDSNKKYAKAICEHFTKHLGIPGDKVSIQFADLDPAFVGTNGDTKA